MFQRGKSWNIEQERTLVDSIRKGYPIGTMLFYRKIVNNKEQYILVDGLQRSSTIRKYITNPTKFIVAEEISEQLCKDVLKIINSNSYDNKKVKDCLLDFINNQKNFDIEIEQCNQLLDDLCKSYRLELKTDRDSITQLTKVIQTFF